MRTRPPNPAPRPMRPATTLLERPPPPPPLEEVDWPVVVEFLASVVVVAGVVVGPTLTVLVSAARSPAAVTLTDFPGPDSSICDGAAMDDLVPESRPPSEVLTMTSVIAGLLDCPVGVGVATALLVGEVAVGRSQRELTASRPFCTSSLEQVFSRQGTTWARSLSWFLGRQMQARSVRVQSVAAKLDTTHET